MALPSSAWRAHTRLILHLLKGTSKRAVCVKCSVGSSMWELHHFLAFCFQLNCMIWIRGNPLSLYHKKRYKDTGEKPLKEVSSYNHSRTQEKEGRVPFPNATGKRVGTKKTGIFPFISTSRYSSIPASSPTHWHWRHALPGSASLCTCLHSFQNGFFSIQFLLFSTTKKALPFCHK